MHKSMIRRGFIVLVAVLCAVAMIVPTSFLKNAAASAANPTTNSTADPLTRKLTIHKWGNDAAGNPQYDTSVSSSTGESVRKEIPGAELTLTTTDGYIKKDSSSTVAVTISADGKSASWTSASTALAVQVAAGSYTLHEAKAPADYNSAADVTFTVPEYENTVDTSKQWKATSTFVITPNTTNAWEYKELTKWESRQAVAVTGDGRKVDPLPAITVTDDSGKSQVVYCYNYLNTTPRGEQFSGAEKYTEYGEAEGSIAMLWKNAANRLTSDSYGTISDATEFARRIMSVTTRGYPNNTTINENNPSNLLAGLDANQQRMVTQLAVWHYTDGGLAYSKTQTYASLVEPTAGNYYGFNDAMIEAYKKLIDPTGYTLQVNEALELFQPDPKLRRYQNLLGSSTITPSAMEANIVDDSIDYSKNPATATISGTKTINGKTISQYGTTGDDATIRNLFGTFKFRIATDTNAPLPASDTAAVGSDGTFSFGAITYTQPGTYVYSVAEIPGDDPDVGYDSTAHTVTVKVTKGTGANAGKLVATVHYADTGGITVNNVYTKDATAQLEVTKTIDGKTPERGAYSFKVQANNNAPMPQGVTAGGATTITNDSVGKAIVSPIVFNKAGTYTYTITEIKPDDADAGISYDTGTVTATVTVTRDDTTNELNAAVSYSKKASDGTVTTGTGSNAFANTTIAPTPVDATISAKKTLDGKTGFGSNRFFFTLQANDSTTPMPADSTNNGSVRIIPANSDGSIDFGTIRYTAEGTYTYTMTESKGADAGIAYDTTSVLVTVKVTRDKATNKLSAAVTYSVDGTESTDPPTFKNTTIKPDDIKEHLYSYKTLAGQPASTGQFTFRITAAKDTPMPSTCASPATDENGDIYCLTANGENGLIDFGPIVYSQAGTYRYTVTEETPSDPYITKDTSSHSITVTVTRDPNTNKLSDTVSYDAGDAPAGFNNMYVKAVPTTAQLRLTKMFDGIPATTDGQFSFELQPVSTDAVDLDGNAVSLPMPADTTKDINGTPTATTSNQGAGHASWGDITFEYPGVYTYAIHEVTGSDPNIVYDSNVYAAKVTVTRNSDNTLSASVSYAGTDALLVIQNTTTTGWVQIKATKLLDGQPAKAGQFTFSVTPSGNAPKLMNTTVTNGDGGLIDFTVPITLADLNGKDSAKFTYTFREIDGGDPTITYDTTDRTASVLVKKVVKDGVTGLRAMVVVDQDKTSADDQNKDYVAYGWDGVTDGTIYHAKAGVTITEDNFDDASNFDLVATPDQGDAYTKHFPKIYNTTKPVTPATATITASKTKDGVAATSGEYSFTLTDPTGSAPMPDGATTSTLTDDDGNTTTVQSRTVPNGDNGAIDFGKITYTKVGIYQYTITENVPNGAASGTTLYDTTKHTASVGVVRSASDPNQLVATVVYDTSTPPVFANTTVPTTAVKVSKTVEGGWPAGAQYTFTMTALSATDDGGSADGAGPLPRDATLTLSKGADGSTSSASFGAFPFTAADAGKTYVYEIRENGANGGAAGAGGTDGATGVKYSKAVYRVSVTVSDTVTDVTQRQLGNKAGIKVTQVVDDDGNTLSPAKVIYDSSASDDTGKSSANQLSFTNERVVTALPFTGGSSTSRSLICGGLIAIIAALLCAEIARRLRRAGQRA
ncbi:Spy0128 family protein [Bifidobacterium apri]|uniref:Collagen adhesion protein n=1 Tax=Bifidobacterium apri TaxID=1769423 RepID=A0A6A2VWP7_9BIFI|nr:FctA domain-containing protein [Bifidobacterium apri]KAB8301978.1 collagen adhesion protein [Bifidobacterium apri]